MHRNYIFKSGSLLSEKLMRMIINIYNKLRNTKFCILFYYWMRLDCIEIYLFLRLKPIFLAKYYVKFVINLQKLNKYVLFRELYMWHFLFDIIILYQKNTFIYCVINLTYKRCDADLKQLSR